MDRSTRDPDKPRLAWSIAEFAKASDTCRDGVYQAIRDNKLVARRVGKRRTIITDDEARRYLNELPKVVLQPRDKSAV
ncbi:MAG: hypothetical protein ACKVP3_14150 [Hyphomicrobiaceae bacterium]